MPENETAHKSSDSMVKSVGRSALGILGSRLSGIVRDVVIAGYWGGAGAPREPHDRDSLYYQNRFRRQHKRFPTWADAMAHCSDVTKAAWKDKLLKAGVSPEELGVDGSSRVD